MINPIGEQQQLQVCQRTEIFISQAEQLLERRFERVPVLFDLSGNAAGMFKADSKRRWIRYNPWIFAKYFDENLRDTVPHEVAHYIVHEVYGKRRTKPHGLEWQALMEAFGADPGVTFKLNLDGIPQRRQRTHLYRCACRDHRVSATRHNRAAAGRGVYCCRYCKSQLVHAEIAAG